MLNKQSQQASDGSRNERNAKFPLSGKELLLVLFFSSLGALVTKLLCFLCGF